jgi:hypothetical protein
MAIEKHRNENEIFLHLKERLEQSGPVGFHLYISPAEALWVMEMAEIEDCPPGVFIGSLIASAYRAKS